MSAKAPEGWRPMFEHPPATSFDRIVYLHELADGSRVIKGVREYHYEERLTHGEDRYATRTVKAECLGWRYADK